MVVAPKTAHWNERNLPKHAAPECAKMRACCRVDVNGSYRKRLLALQSELLQKSTLSRSFTRTYSMPEGTENCMILCFSSRLKKCILIVGMLRWPIVVNGTSRAPSSRAAESRAKQNTMCFDARQYRKDIFAIVARTVLWNLWASICVHENALICTLVQVNGCAGKNVNRG